LTLVAYFVWENFSRSIQKLEHILRIFMYRINLLDWDLRDLDLLNQLEYQNISEMGNVLF
jgi:hypothetical protein